MYKFTLMSLSEIKFSLVAYFIGITLKMKSLNILIILSILGVVKIVMSTRHEGDDCSISSHGNAKCKKLQDCKYMERLFKNYQNLPRKDRALYIESQHECEDVNLYDSLLVCCVEEERDESQQERARLTPECRISVEEFEEKFDGTCYENYQDCEFFDQLVKNFALTKSKKVKEYLKENKCGNGKKYKPCCPSKKEDEDEIRKILGLDESDQTSKLLSN
jgi:hypothetical protein